MIDHLLKAEPQPLYIQRKLVNPLPFIEWAKAQGFPKVLSPEELHVTVVYSNTAVDWDALDVDETPISVAGGPRSVIPLGGDGAVVLKFDSQELQDRHKRWAEAGASWDHEEYQCHVTISYNAADVELLSVKPYTEVLEFGPEIYEPINKDYAATVVEKGAPFGNDNASKNRKTMHRGVGDGSSSSKALTWVTPDKATAEGYASKRPGGRVDTMDVDLENTFDAGHDNREVTPGKFAIEAMTKARESGRSNLTDKQMLEVRADFVKDQPVAPVKISDLWADEAGKARVASLLSRLGFDSVHLLEGDKPTYGLLKKGAPYGNDNAAGPRKASPDVVAGIKEYTARGGDLAGRNTATAEQRKALDEWLGSGTTGKDQTLYQGTAFSQSEWDSDWQHWTTEGNTIELRSQSFSENRARTGGYKGGAHPVKFLLEGGMTGRDIQKDSVYPVEQEHLAAKGNKYTVLGWDMTPGGTHLIRIKQAPTEKKSELQSIAGFGSVLKGAPFGNTNAAKDHVSPSTESPLQTSARAKLAALPNLPMGNAVSPRELGLQVEGPKGRGVKIYVPNATDLRTATVQDIKVDSIKTLQGYIERDKLDTMLKQGISDTPTPVVLLKHKGQHYLLDGNHRLAQSTLLGADTMKAKVFDMDEVTGKIIRPVKKDGLQSIAGFALLFKGAPFGNQNASKNKGGGSTGLTGEQPHSDPNKTYDGKDIPTHTLEYVRTQLGELEAKGIPCRMTAEEFHEKTMGRVDPVEMVKAIWGEDEYQDGKIMAASITEHTGGQGADHLRGGVSFAGMGTVHGSKVDFVERVLHPGMQAVDHAYLKMSEGEDNKGTARSLFEKSVPLYKKMGIKAITVHANLEAGAYAWNKFGFAADHLPHVRSQVEEGWANIVKKANEGVPKEYRQKLTKEALEEMDTLREIMASDDKHMGLRLASLPTPHLDARFGHVYDEAKDQRVPNGVPMTFMKTAMSGKHWTATHQFSDPISEIQLTRYLMEKKPPKKT